MAQPSTRPRLDDPRHTWPGLPDFKAPQPSPGAVLPLAPLPPPPAIKSLFPGPRILVRHVHIVGNTVLPQAALDAIAAPYEGNELSYADLEKLCDQLTAEYIVAGFVSSGAVLPDQTILKGVVEIRIVESKLCDIEPVIMGRVEPEREGRPEKPETKGRLRQSYIRSRVQNRKCEIANVNRIEKALQLLRQDPRIQTLEAKLLPGAERGESRLEVAVHEGSAHREVLRLNNYQPLSVGAAGGGAIFTHMNLSGFGDTLSGSFRGTHGLRGASLMYSLPVAPDETTLSLHADVARSEVVQEPFADLGIKSSMETYGFTLVHPVRRTPASDFGISFTGELRRSQSFLLGSGFRFTDDLTEDGVARVSVIRFGQSWMRSTIGQALAVRSVLSIGLNIFGATHPGNSSDARFVAWLGQFQWARRVRALGNGAQVILRADAQLANTQLPGLEKYVIGGRETVRGYRENELVRDNGLLGSVEARIPVRKWGDQAVVLEAAPFADAGRSWNCKQPSVAAETLPSAGVGLRVRNRNRLQAEIYWGYAFRDLGTTGKWSLQDSGIHLGFVWSLP